MHLFICLFITDFVRKRIYLSCHFQVFFFFLSFTEEQPVRQCFFRSFFHHCSIICKLLCISLQIITIGDKGRKTAPKTISSNKEKKIVHRGTILFCNIAMCKICLPRCFQQSIKLVHF